MDRALGVRKRVAGGVCGEEKAEVEARRGDDYGTVEGRVQYIAGTDVRDWIRRISGACGGRV